MASKGVVIAGRYNLCECIGRFGEGRRWREY